MNGNTTMRFGVLGTGRITRRLVADLQSTDGVDVSAIASRDAERARWYADQYGIATAVTGYSELLSREDVDAVYVSLPPSLHAEWSIAAAEQGKHVLCEKPLAMSEDQARQIDAACSSRGVRWLDATGWLHHSRTAAFSQWMSEGRFGAIGHVSVAMSFFRPFQSGEHRLDKSLGGGCLLDLGWYCAGVVRYALAGKPQRVYAQAVYENEVPIRVNAMMWFSNHASASFSCGYDTSTRKWFEFAGAEASLVCDDFSRPWHDRPARCWIHNASGDVESNEFSGNQEREMIKRFIGQESLADLQRQALDTQSILDALSQSCESGCEVTLPS